MGEHDLLVLDIDRTLLKSGEFSAIVTDSLAEMLRLSDDQARYLSEQARVSKGKSFDYLTWAADTFGIKLPNAAQLMAHILRRSEIVDLEKRMVIPGTLEVLKAAKARGVPVLLMTAGSELLQQMKVKVLQAVVAAHDFRETLDDYIITAPHQIKASLLVEAFADNQFEITRLTKNAVAYNITDNGAYTNITDIFLIDDKVEYLQTEDRRLHGILVAADGEKNGEANTLDLFGVAKLIKS